MNIVKWRCFYASCDSCHSFPWPLPRQHPCLNAGSCTQHKLAFKMCPRHVVPLDKDPWLPTYYYKLLVPTPPDGSWETPQLNDMQYSAVSLVVQTSHLIATAAAVISCRCVHAVFLVFSSFPEKEIRCSDRPFPEWKVEVRLGAAATQERGSCPARDS
jgi:hypothetical protein